MWRGSYCFEEVVEFECYFRSLLRGFGLITQPLVLEGFFFRIEGRKEGGIALLNSYVYHSFGLEVGELFLCLFSLLCPCFYSLHYKFMFEVLYVWEGGLN